jgi:hypothetical protein
MQIFVMGIFNFSTTTGYMSPQKKQCHIAINHIHTTKNKNTHHNEHTLQYVEHIYEVQL